MGQDTASQLQYPLELRGGFFKIISLDLARNQLNQNLMWDEVHPCDLGNPPQVICTLS